MRAREESLRDKNRCQFDYSQQLIVCRRKIINERERIAPKWRKIKSDSRERWKNLRNNNKYDRKEPHKPRDQTFETSIFGLISTSNAPIICFPAHFRCVFDLSRLVCRFVTRFNIERWNESSLETKKKKKKNDRTNVFFARGKWFSEWHFWKNQQLENGCPFLFVRNQCLRKLWWQKKTMEFDSNK